MATGGDDGSGDSGDDGRRVRRRRTGPGGSGAGHDRAGRAGERGELPAVGQGGLRDVEDPRQSRLVHPAARRRHRRDLLPAHRHAGRSPAGLRRHRSRRLRRPGRQRRHAAHRPGRPAQPHLPPDRHRARRVAAADHLRHRPGTVGIARRRPLPARSTTRRTGSTRCTSRRCPTRRPTTPARTSGTHARRHDADACQRAARPARLHRDLQRLPRHAATAGRDLSDNGRMDWHYSSAPNGNIVQTGQTALTGRSGHRNAVLTVGLRGRPRRARSRPRRAPAAARRSRAPRRRYAAGWHHYLDGLRPAAGEPAHRRRSAASTWSRRWCSPRRRTSCTRGAYVASPTMPWAWGGRRTRPGPYHLVWSRDLYEIATALIADGDRAGAERALTFLFDKQQKPDGSFPQNSTVDGTPFWTGLQLDEVADPIVLAYQLHRIGAAAWQHVKARGRTSCVVQPGRLRRAVHAAGALGEPERLLARDHRRARSPAWSARRSIARHNGDTASASKYLNDCRLVARAPEGLDGDRATGRTRRSRTSCG